MPYFIEYVTIGLRGNWVCACVGIGVTLAGAEGQGDIVLWQLIKVRLGKAIKREQELGSDLCRTLSWAFGSTHYIGVTTCVGHLVGLLEAHTKGAATRIQST